MIDYVKYTLKGVLPETLENNPLLYFTTQNVTDCGELIPITKNGRLLKNSNEKPIYYTIYKQAYHQGLTFKIYDTTKNTTYKRITIEGSLHKYWNNGEHNFNDFCTTTIYETLKDLEIKFGILPNNCILMALELGVNLKPPYRTKTILNQALLHKTKRFKWIYTNDEGNYIQTKHQRHIIKIYDKRTHYKNKGYDIDQEILRFEIKYTKMKYLNDKSIYTLNDLLNHGLNNFETNLLKEWNNVLIYDNKALKDTKYETLYNNPSYWTNLPYNQLKYHRNNLNSMLEKHPDNIKFLIADLIKNKCRLLTENTPN